MGSRDVTAQTLAIVQCLFEEPGELKSRQLIECDGGPDDGDPFDPVVIADKLRELGDDYDAKVLQPLIKNLKQTAKDQMVSAFTDSVTTVCKSWVSTQPIPEQLLLKASVQLGMYVANKCPELKSAIQGAMGTFLNTSLLPWVVEQGGWEEVTSQ
ncbi:bcl-2-like protein 15 [Arapaima gigas]